MTYRCIFRSKFQGYETWYDRRLDVSAKDVYSAISVLTNQMNREGETLTRVIAIAPLSMLSEDTA